jgi:hypothetical protein
LRKIFPAGKNKKMPFSEEKVENLNESGSVNFKKGV